METARAGFGPRPSTDGAEAAARSYPNCGIMSTGAAGDVAFGWFLDHAWLTCCA
jgi:hypothetical protein